MAKEYIERNALIAEYDRVHIGPPGGARKLMEDAPAADVVEVKHGEWVEVNQVGKNSRHINYTTKKCSVCGYWNGRRKSKYCPNCGVKMDGDKNDL